MGKRPATFRTRKLSPTTPMVLHPTGCGRVGNRRNHTTNKGVGGRTKDREHTRVPCFPLLHPPPPFHTPHQHTTQHTPTHTPTHNRGQARTTAHTTPHSAHHTPPHTNPSKTTHTSTSPTHKQANTPNLGTRSQATDKGHKHHRHAAKPPALSPLDKIDARHAEPTHKHHTTGHKTTRTNRTQAPQAADKSKHSTTKPGSAFNTQTTTSDSSTTPNRTKPEHRYTDRHPAYVLDGAEGWVVVPRSCFGSLEWG